MPVYLRSVKKILQVHYHTLNSSRVLNTQSFDYLNQFLPRACQNSNSLSSINAHERRKLTVGLSNVIKHDRVYILKGFSREFYSVFLVKIMKLLQNREAAFAFFKLAFRDDSEILRSSCVAAHLLAANNLQFLAQDMVSYVIETIGSRRSRQLMELMWEDHCRYESHFSVLNTLMRGFLNAEMDSEALEVVGMMREIGVSPSSSATRILFKLLLRIGDYGSVWKLFKDLVRMGPPPSTHTFNMMILGFSRKGLVKVGENLLHVMRKFHCEPDVFAYNIVINGNCMKGQTSRALEWMHFMISNGCAPNIVTFNTVIHALSKEGDMEKARRYFYGITDMGISPNTITYNIMLDGYVKAGDIDEAEMLYEEMRNKGISPDGLSFNIFIAGRYKYGIENIGDTLLSDIAEPQLFPDCSLFDVSVAGFCWMGRLDEAMEFVENMLERGFPISVVAFNSIIAAYSKAGLEEKARRAYKIMTRFGLTPSSSTCAYLLIGLCKKRCLNEARELLHKMIEKDFCINKLAFLVLLDGYLRTGDLIGARSLWDEMEKRGIFPDTVSFAVFVNGLAKVGLLEEAYDMLLEMARKGFVHSNFAYNSLIRWFYNYGKLKNKY
ncbi:hypothetical protein UlMin_036834 [Ulmus minor]